MKKKKRDTIYWISKSVCLSLPSEFGFAPEEKRVWQSLRFFTAGLAV
jgi:hypothetical protein